jgi:hypothetical protein
MPMNQSARTFIMTVIALGAIVMMHAAIYWTGNVLVLASYIVLAALASTLKVQLPGIPGTFSANCLVTVLSITQLTTAQFIVVSVVCALVQSRWRAAKEPLAVQVAFNAGVFAISAAASSWTYNSIERLAPAISGIAPLLIASCVFFFIDTGAVSVVVALVDGVSPLKIWRVWHIWTLPYYLINVALAVLVISFVPASVLLVTAFVIFMMLGQFAIYRWLVRKAAPAVPRPVLSPPTVS